ncbi:hypothetical protein [Azospirillum thermophilum]|uniref:Uncharacterized protein n=1 Tax=Azospirillum thermophilum TaxID=2202148 RepID=A0A2S2CKJ7_9PROT|nr:hypothetical protein [Azospirillum thermophilum]AWK84837.1 hypothetical protein DEW08_00320 [Azospirillum thermophilum]
MRFVELTDTAGAAVMLNGAGVLFLRAAADGITEIHLSGRAEPLRVALPLDDVARALEDAVPEPREPPDPTMALLS